MNLLVTGGTGTFGRAFISLALRYPRIERLAIFSRDEAKQHELQLQYPNEKRLRFLLGDVRDYDRLRFAFEGVDAVVHAAALKHVPSGEKNPFEHVKTNIAGSQNVAMAAATAGVKKVLALSSDKAVEPINLYGATKMAMERLMIASNGLGRATLYSCVRYGNVIGSRGSFVELLQGLKARGATEFPLRSLESTRFWMTAEEAALFVWARLIAMKGGEIFVPQLPSSTALEFARKYLPNAEPRIVGVPPGEKIHETLISEAESQYVIRRGTLFEIHPRGQRDETITPWRYTSNEAMVTA